jgi:hypothetical protein
MQTDLKCLRCGSLMEPAVRVNYDTVRDPHRLEFLTEKRSGLTAEEERRYALTRYERPIVFLDDVKQPQRSSRNRKYGQEHRFRPEDYEEIKSQREQALEEKSQRK